MKIVDFHSAKTNVFRGGVVLRLEKSSSETPLR
jgi:hypothetical protein